MDIKVKSSMAAAALAAIGASACCAGPLILLSLGIGGAWIGNLTALEPYRPIFVALVAAFMTMGVATANSILMVSFARKRLAEGEPPLSAALEAGATRLRPVLMTALAMILGMLPMALGLGDGGEQNAPLGRAAIGGLLFATLSTLIFVPLVFAEVHQRLQRRAATLPPARPHAEGNP